MDTDTAVEIANLKKDVQTMQRDQKELVDRVAESQELMSKALSKLSSDFTTLKWVGIMLILFGALGVEFADILTILGKIL